MRSFLVQVEEEKVTVLALSESGRGDWPWNPSQAMNESSLMGRKVLIKLASFSWYHYQWRSSLKSPLHKSAFPARGSLERKFPFSSVTEVGESSKGKGIDTSVKQDMKRSFAKVVTGCYKQGMETVVVGSDIIRGNTNWLARSMVGCVRWEGVIPSIPGFFQAWGLAEVKIAKLGGHRLLLSFLNMDDASVVMKNHSFKVLEVFLSLKRWKPGFFTLSKTCGVRCAMECLFMVGMRRL